MKRKLLIVALMILCVVALAACGEDGEDAIRDITTVPSAPATSSGVIQEQSFQNPVLKDGKWDVAQLVQIKAENFPEAPEGVYMTVKSVEDGKVTATMHNDTAEEWDYDKLSYTLQVKLDDVWYTVPRRDNIVWSDVAIRTWMNPGDKVERTYGLGDWGELPSGTYRVAQMISQGTLVEKNLARWFLMAEFEIS